MRRPKSLALLVALAAALAAAESLPDQCRSPKRVGPCRASFHRWWYNATSQMCQEFIFGGCKGNANNFFSEQECFQTCTTEITEDPEDVGAHTHLPSEPFGLSTRAVILAVLLAVLAALLLGAMAVFFIKICQKNPARSVGTVWSTLDDKEYLMSSAYTL